MSGPTNPIDGTRRIRIVAPSVYGVLTLTPGTVLSMLHVLVDSILNIIFSAKILLVANSS